MCPRKGCATRSPHNAEQICAGNEENGCATVAHIGNAENPEASPSSLLRVCPCVSVRLDCGLCERMRWHEHDTGCRRAPAIPCQKHRMNCANLVSAELGRWGLLIVVVWRFVGAASLCHERDREDRGDAEKEVT